MSESQRPTQRPTRRGIGRRIGGAVGGVLDEAVGLAWSSVSSVGGWADAARWLPGYRKQALPDPGARPGIDHLPEAQTPPEPGSVPIRCIDYSEQTVADQEVVDLEGFLNASRPETTTVRWINVDGLHPHVIHLLQDHFGFHGLAAEDVLHVPQRPKAEAYEGHFFIVARMFRLQGEHLISEQVSFFVKRDLILSFQESTGDVWEPVRARLLSPHTKLRTGDASYLLYALLDALVDHCFPIMERYGEELDELEQRLLNEPSPSILHRLHEVKRELTVLRRVMWPTREMLRGLMQDELDLVDERVKVYLRDVHEHTIQIVELIETFRDMVGNMTDLYLSVLSVRTNEIMKVLTIIATIFIPLTFLAGVYGMNFEYLPELRWSWAYPAFWGICAAAAAGLLWYFRRKGWLGARN